MTDNQKANRWRHRVNWRGKLILQIEESYNNADDRDPNDLGQTATRWRDARVEDISKWSIIK